MMIYLSAIALVIVVLVYRHWQNPYRHSVLYRCIEDGENSALYLYGCRYHSFAGGFTVDLFRRVTCAPGVEYTAATSDWFNPWCGHSRKFLCHFERVPHAEAHRLLAIQLPVTRAVWRQIAAAKLGGGLKPNRGFSAT